MRQTMASSKSSMEAHLALYEIILSAAKPMTLRAAILLNIPDIIAIHGGDNPLTVEQIASHISTSTHKPAHTEYLFRIMRLLASINVFSEESTVDYGGTPQFKYGLTSLSKILVKNGAQKSCAPTVLAINVKCVVDAYQHLHDSVIDGVHAFTKAHGMNLFEYMSNNPEPNRIFNEGMASDTSPIMAYVVKFYDGFKSFKSVVDVAGGVGSAISVIVEEYPHIHGINFDLPHVIRTAALIQGIENVEGNMFEKIPSADAIFMKVPPTIPYTLWKERNNRTFKEKKKLIQALLHIVKRSIKENFNATTYPKRILFPTLIDTRVKQN